MNRLKEWIQDRYAVEVWMDDGQSYILCEHQGVRLLPTNWAWVVPYA